MNKMNSKATLYLSLFAVTMKLSSSFSPSCTSGWEVEMVPLSFGFIVLACAVSPYVLAIPFPAFLENSFFLPTYMASTAGRIAEIEWKVRYATLGFALTALPFLEFISGRSDPKQILRDSYILWAIFYTDAALKVRREARAKPPIFIGNRAFTQTWHIFVAVALWVDVSESYTGNAITNSIATTFGPLVVPLFN